MENPSALFSSSWSFSHDCAKISHGHAKLLFTFPLVCCKQNPSCFISHDYAKIPHGYEKLKNMLFQLLFAISPISSFLIHLHHLQFSSKVWSKCTSSSSASIMYPPPFHFPFVTPCFKNHLRISPKLNKKPLVSLARVAMYYFGILGIITTQKV